ncbi:MAG: hypothetical protein HYR98_00505 [Nitrospirae bacterium]|nr:hypothetical protein [Nitrospirota bacterium]MBI3394187.1 hypothetical protein [Nitrospirota bacterium]
MRKKTNRTIRAAAAGFLLLAAVPAWAAEEGGGFYDYKKSEGAKPSSGPTHVLSEDVRSRIDKVVAQNLWHRRAWREEIERALLKAETKDQEFAVLGYFEQAVVREWSRRYRVYEGRVIVDDPYLGWLRCYDLCYKVCRESQNQRVCAESCGRACDRSYPPR